MNINAIKSVVCICYECIPDAESVLKGNLSIYFWCFTLILHVNLFLIYFTFLLKVGEGGYRDKCITLLALQKNLEIEVVLHVLQSHLSMEHLLLIFKKFILTGSLEIDRWFP